MNIAHSRRFAARVAALSGGSAVGQLALVLVVPLLTRLYDPHDLGVYGTFTSLVTIGAAGASLRYETAILTADTSRDAIGLALLAVALTIPTGAILVGTGWALQLFGWQWVGGVPRPGFLLLLPVLSVIQGFAAMRYLLLREGAFPSVAGAGAAQGFGRAVAPVALGIVGLGWFGLALGDLLGRLAGSLVLVPRVHSVFAKSGYRTSVGTLWETSKRHREYALYATPSAVVNALAIALPLPLIAGLYGHEAAGQFAVAQMIMYAPMGLVGRAVADVFHARIAEVARSEPNEIHRIFLRTSRLLVLAGLGPALVVSLYGRAGSESLLGDEWGSAGDMLSLLVPWALMAFVASSVSRVVLVAAGQRLKLVFDLMSVAMVIGVCLGGSAAGFGLTRTVWLLGWSQATAYGVYWVMLWRMAKGLTRVQQ